MTIAFSTHINKKLTHFVEKIWVGILPEYKNITISDYEDYTIRHKERFNTPMSEYDQMMIDAKIHTIREDSKDRWKRGMKIHPVINNRTKNRFQFTPELVVKNIQKIEILHSKSNPGIARITIDEKPFYEGPTWSCYKRHLEDFVRNDGFETVEEFFSWFKKDFTGKIIHWTTFNY